MKYYYVNAEVPGELGEGTIMDTKSHPPLVTKLHIEFNTWLSSSLLQVFPCWIATAAAANEINSAKLSGVTFDAVCITVSELFTELNPNIDLPKFLWMKIHGVQGDDDFGVGTGFMITPTKQFFDHRRFILVASERALDVLTHLGISHAIIEDFPK